MSKYNEWTKKEDEKLKSVYSIKKRKEIERMFPNRNWTAIQIRANRLGLKSWRSYSVEDKLFIKNNYDKMTVEEISKKINKPIDSIKRRIREFGIIEQKIWTDEENLLLKNNFGKYSIQYIFENILPKRSISSIYHQCQYLNLSKKTNRYNNKKELLFLLKKLAEKLNRTPLSSELLKYGLPSVSTYGKNFGGYTEACEKIGLDLNVTIYSQTKCYYSKNGDKCRSKSEQIITNFIIDNKIKFIMDGYYKDVCKIGNVGKKRYDWLIEGNIIEYFGLVRNKKYKIKMSEKINICSMNNINLIQIFEKDLFHLEEIFAKFIKDKNP